MLSPKPQIIYWKQSQMDSPVITEVTACEVFHIGTAFPYTYFGEFDLDIPENGLE